MTKTKTLTRPYDTAENLDSDEAIAYYLEEAIEIGDPAFIVDAIGVVARAKGMTEISRVSGLSRESLYKALRSDGNPEFGTVMKVMAAMGLKLAVEPVRHGAKKPGAARKAASKKSAPPKSAPLKTANPKSAAAKRSGKQVRRAG